MHGSASVLSPSAKTLFFVRSRKVMQNWIEKLPVLPVRQQVLPERRTLVRCLIWKPLALTWPIFASTQVLNVHPIGFLSFRDVELCAKLNLQKCIHG